MDDRPAEQKPDNTDKPDTPEVKTAPPQVIAESEKPGEPKAPSIKKLLITCGFLIVLLIALGAVGIHILNKKTKTNNSGNSVTLQTEPSTSTSSTQGLQLNTSKNYGDKYANGLLPVGDGKYTTSGPKQGYIYACSQYATSLSSGNGGASKRGPWFTDNNTEYNVNDKLHVEGDVMWQADFTDTISSGDRTIITNDLPSQPTGIFPIAGTDTAYQYDQNPNHIEGQTLTYKLNANPSYGNPNCMGGEAGIMLTGVALFNAFDAGGRDAGAWEIQDNCDGHPDSDSIYHYHTLSTCIKDTSVHTVIGFALDGFPITGPVVGPNNVLTTDDLDVCHGLTSQINLDGKSVTMYHYVMTEDFPYSVSCFRGTAIQPPDMSLHNSSNSQKLPPPPRP